jgi:hypothetical protein
MTGTYDDELGGKTPEEQAVLIRASQKEAFVQETFSEVDQMELEKLKSNSDIAKIIASDKKAVASIIVDGVQVNFTPFVSRPVRHQLSKLQKIGTPTMEEAEELIYETLSLLCTDYPYNRPLTWKFIEANGGDAGSHLAEIMGKIATRAEQMRKFQ